jgi:hypothetical protein
MKSCFQEYEFIRRLFLASDLYRFLRNGPDSHKPVAILGENTLNEHFNSTYLLFLSGDYVLRFRLNIEHHVLPERNHQATLEVAK